MKTKTLLIVMAGCALAALTMKGPSVAADPGASQGTLASSRCVSAYGKTACGYQCKAAYGEVACAQTPIGACMAAYGHVRCWDPPRRRYRRAHQRWPQATCRAAYGKIACGYSCVAAYGGVQCATRPDGACRAAYGRITCTP